MALTDRLPSHDGWDGKYFKMVEGMTSTTEFSILGKPRTPAPTNGVEAK